MKRLVLILAAVLFLAANSQAVKWRSHFAYNNVTQIAMSDNRVYAVSDGSLFSVDKQSEKITIYNRQSGLHSTGISCIGYDDVYNQLIIAYKNGKIDVLSNRGVQYISGLYDKDMTQQKTVYNITFYENKVFFATHYGIQVMDLRENKLTDSYWLRPNGTETPLSDVRIIGDSIYAFGKKSTNTADSLYCASMQDNIVDYRFWKREKNRGRITTEPEKGTHCYDGRDNWYAGYDEGIVRYTPTERLAYIPPGPLVNMPYRITESQGLVFVVPGGRWDTQYKRHGIIMYYDGTQWTNISNALIREQSGAGDVLDFMNVAVDPQNKKHYYVTSYGTGLYEFQGTECVGHWIAGDDNPMTAAANNSALYTRIDGACFDSENNLWFVNAGGSKVDNRLICRTPEGEWHGVPVQIDGNNIAMPTPAGLIIDKRNPSYKWLATARSSTSLYLVDDEGTPFDSSDDRVMRRNEWINQHGQRFAPDMIYSMHQDHAGRIWLATEQGAAYVDSNTDFFTSDAIVQPDIMDSNGENPVLTQGIKAICVDSDDCVWLGSESLGVYVLNNTATEIIAHYTTDNSTMPSNSIMSLACTENDLIYIGTSEGLVECDPSAPSDGLSGYDEDVSKENNNESMLQWRLHFSYTNPVEMAATPDRVYGVAHGALFYVDRATDTPEYLSKESGLNGSTVAHIAYDEKSGQMIVAYEDGRIDLIDKDDNIRQMPDLYMKANSIAVTINSITVGSQATYLAMPFGILAINTQKAEVSDTYYIGEDAGMVDVRQVVETEDSLYAFTQDMVYSISLTDNKVDYTYWHRQSLPEVGLTQAAVYKNELYTVQHDTLFRRRNNNWQQVLEQPIDRIHVSDGKMVICQNHKKVSVLGDDDKLQIRTDKYGVNDALYTQGEYWLAEVGWGLIRLSTDGSAGQDDYFHTRGPNTNFGYSMCAAHDRVYIVNGGRWAAEYSRPAALNIYDGYNWKSYNVDYFANKLSRATYDPVSVAVDPNDAGHFFMATYGTGLYEFKDFGETEVKYYGENNSTLRAVNNTIDKEFYTRTDGVTMDKDGNLWVMNATKKDGGKPLHVLSPNGLWTPISLRSSGQEIQFTTPSGIWIDRRDSNRKWMLDQRSTQGVVLLDDGGTPTSNNDDHCKKRSAFVDQNGNDLTPATFRCIVQDRKNRIWIGTQTGIILIPANVDFFTSNACCRIIIPRNDGTGLGDYLLGNEQINCMAVDGGDRIWIGTANSGLYLIEDDTITVEHFTENNSLLPSNSIQSIAILPSTGEVFVGTDKGIASYQSDASEAQADFTNAYAYPNPVRPDYTGVITIVGLMDNTVVNIVDAGGNLVCKTKSHGGTAVWDGNNAYGSRATPGIYTALCNEQGGKHTVVKILVIR